MIIHQSIQMHTSSNNLQGLHQSPWLKLKPMKIYKWVDFEQLH